MTYETYVWIPQGVRDITFDFPDTTYLIDPALTAESIRGLQQTNRPVAIDTISHWLSGRHYVQADGRAQAWHDTLDMFTHPGLELVLPRYAGVDGRVVFGPSRFIPRREMYWRRYAAWQAAATGASRLAYFSNGELAAMLARTDIRFLAPFGWDAPAAAAAAAAAVPVAPVGAAAAAVPAGPIAGGVAAAPVLIHAQAPAVPAPVLPAPAEMPQPPPEAPIVAANFSQSGFPMVGAPPDPGAAVPRANATTTGRRQLHGCCCIL
jgi:hypothetical protein